VGCEFKSVCATVTKGERWLIKIMVSKSKEGASYLLYMKGKVVKVKLPSLRSSIKKKDIRVNSRYRYKGQVLFFILTIGRITNFRKLNSLSKHLVSNFLKVVLRSIQS
jgi:hypothetical protein